MVKQQGRNIRAWTSREVVRLRELKGYGAVIIAGILDRSEASVRMKAHHERISLRRPGVRTGLILGQLRDTSWANLVGVSPSVAGEIQRMRELVLAGELDPSTLEEADAGELCPGCGLSPVEVPRSGFCRACHHTVLAQRLRERTDREARAAAGQREHWQERQSRSRSNRRTKEAPDGD